MVLVPGGGRFGLSTTSPSNVWLRLTGTLAETPIIKLEPSTLQFTFQVRAHTWIASLIVKVLTRVY